MGGKKKKLTLVAKEKKPTLVKKTTRSSLVDKTNESTLVDKSQPIEDAGPVLIMPGPRRGCNVYLDSRGYSYRIDSTRPNGSKRMKCVYRKCRGAAVMVDVEGTLFISPRTDHNNCSVSSKILELWAVKQRIFDRCRSEPDTAFSVIYLEETVGSPAAELTSLSQLMPSMRRYRRETDPEITES
uniref:V-type ATP synthase beta chain n=2 Tax=Lygus hesperus TaxID=30085 RepID=A0A0A9XTR0_LYGHE